MAFVINHNYPKDKALTMVKKALSGKFGIIKDNGYTLKAGAPMNPATIEVTDSEISVSGGALAKLFVDSIGSEIKLYFEEKQEEKSVENNSAPAKDKPSTSNSGGYTLQEYFDYQERGIGIIKSYKELLDANIITEEEFNDKKAEILNFIKGIMKH